MSATETDNEIKESAFKQKKAVDIDSEIKKNAFTTKNYRDVYPAIDPTRPELAQAGKVVVITGASRGLGRSVSCDGIP